ncbi:MAG: universal stress protein [Bacteroidales bacterium]|nr:universal stress protein [Bacteroidales bacterium]
MGKVVVGFDFSSGSAYAVDLAIDIANRWQSDIRLVYVKEKKEDEAPIRAEIERRNAGVAHLLKGIKLEYILRQGNPAEELAKQAEEDDASLVIVGTHGMSGMRKSLLGRNSYRTVELSPVPVLLIREDFNFNKALENIVVPIDSSDDTRQKIGQAATFAKTFGSKIHLLGLFTSAAPSVRQVVKNYISMVQRYLDSNNIEYSTEFMAVKGNVTTDTIEYAERVGADMIAIMTEQESSLTSLIMGNFAQQMLTQSKIPVLTVRPKKVLADTAQY